MLLRYASNLADKFMIWEEVDKFMTMMFKLEIMTNFGCVIINGGNLFS